MPSTPGSGFPATGSHGPLPKDRHGLHVLRGGILCGLVLTAGVGEGVLHAGVRAVLPLLAGLGFATALGKSGTRDPHLTRAWALHLAALWLATLSPMMWGNREVVRTSAVAGGILLVGHAAGRRRILPIAGVLLALLAAVASPWAGLAPLGTGDIPYALGVAWPRGWPQVGRDAALFFCGSWAAGGRAIRTVAGRSGYLARALGGLGRMPLTTAVVQGGVAWIAVRMGSAEGLGRPLALDAVLVAQLFFATWWLRERVDGPCEGGLRTLRRWLISLGIALARALRRPRSARPPRAVPGTMEGKVA